ncbi:MAG TPA: hypothetical protein VK985_10275 [Rariglobus sp.]|nr:hypothetical protein [Rariglobus sp.]
MATASVAFAELTAHTLSLAVLSGRKVTALRSFSLDAKADIAAFVAEHQISGVTRASVLGAQNFFHPSSEEETASVRQPAALLAHIAKLPHGFVGTPFSVVVDAGTGVLPAPTTPSPWIATVVEASEIEDAKAKLAELGLAPAAVTLAAPAQFGVIAASLSPGETALVLLPGENDAHIAWVGTDGTQALAVVPAGYAQMFEAVQTGLGLKFKTAAGKLFYNENYDFSEAAPKVAAALAPAIQAFLTDAPATHLHIAGLISSQTWLVNNLAVSLKLTPWAPAGAALASHLTLDAGSVAITSSTAGVLPLASAGANDTAWVQSSLDTQAAKVKPAAPAPAAKPAVVAPVKPAQAAAPVAKPAAPALAAKPAPKPAPAVIESVKAQPASKPAPKPAASQPPAAAPVAKASPSPAAKSKTGPIIIGTTVVVVAAVVGLAAFFKRPNSRTPAAQQPEAAAPAVTATKPVATAAPTPPAAPAVTSVDKFASDQRKFGNDRYRFEVADKGFIQALSTTSDEVLVESAAGISLQGSYVGTDGRRKWFNVGGVDDAGYVATVRKSVQAGVTVFDVKVTHPRFELTQTFSCLPRSIKVAAKFNPINLRDPRGVIAAVHSVRLSPVALNPTQRMKPAADNFSYAMKAGTLGVTFDSTYWVRDGIDGRQTVIAGENGVAFHFTDSTEPTRNLLNYEISLP